mmetsp:Transcript_10422/g.20134  ORF Transcript_10422/g.20134 Transcript_10422/m.20134 type:complete len:188 (-) Transcript_10422:45-608(-)
MVKSKFFPLKAEDEDHLYEDSDEHFRSLPYYEEIPDMSAYGSRIAPRQVNLKPFDSARERISIYGFVGLLCGFVFSHSVINPMIYGSVTPWKRKWAMHGICGTIFSMGCIIMELVIDPACSPYLLGRRAPMFEHEATRHALDAKYNLYDCLDKVMHSRERISKQQFYNSYTTAMMRRQAELEEKRTR